MTDEEKQKYISLIGDFPMVHSIDDSRKYLKIYTNILLGESQNYLNLFLVWDEEGACLTDSNEIYAQLDDYYDLTEESLALLAAKYDIEFNRFQFYKLVDLSTVIMEMKKYKALVEDIISEDENSH